MTEKITNETTIDAPLQTVRRALTTNEGCRGWWTKDCDVGSKRAAFRFDGGDMEVRFAVEDAGDAAVRWRCDGNKGNDDWQDTTVRFDLRETGGRTHVAFVHDGFKSKTKVYEMCVGGWAHFLASLKSYVETGRGTPHGA
jgi:uncharacterized protein YndB with AHSA1/START domain